MRYAIIESGNKQFRVKEGDVFDVELLNSTTPVIFTVLFFHDGTAPHIGSPYVQNCSVEAEIIGESKGPKVIAYKYKKRKNYRRLVGHRQRYSRVKITKLAAV